mgnify:CR=1 FL=1
MRRSARRPGSCAAGLTAPAAYVSLAPLELVPAGPSRDNDPHAVHARAATRGPQPRGRPRPYAPGGYPRGGRHELRRRRPARLRRRPVPAPDRRRRRRGLRAARGHARAPARRLGRARERRGARPALRLPRPRRVEPLRGAAGQPPQAHPRPLRPRPGGRPRPGAGDLRPRGRRRLQPPVRALHALGPGLGRARGRRRGHGPLLPGGPRAEGARGAHRHLRDPRQGADPQHVGRAPGAARHLRGPGPPGHRELPQEPGRDHDRGAAHPRLLLRGLPADQGPDELLGLLDPVLLRPGALLRHARRPQGRAPGRPRRGPRHGLDPARGRPGDHHGRGLQPHLRVGDERAEPVPARPGRPGVLPARPPPPRPVHRRHRHRQHGRLPLHARRPAHPGLPALLGGRRGRGRLPLRPGGHAGAQRHRVPPPPPPAGGHGHRPAALGRQAHRRALGRGPGRLADRGVPRPLPRLERPLPRHGALLLAGGRVRDDPGPARLGRARPGHAPGRQRRHVQPRGVPGRARAPGERQLRHRPRRLHAARPGQLRPQEQPGQRRGQPRRHRRQPLVEPRDRRGRPRGDRRRPPRGAAAAQFAQRAGHPPGLGRHPHAAGRRRDGPLPGRQQQLLLPGLPDLLVRLGPGALAERPHRHHALPAAPARRAPGHAPGRLRLRPARGRGRDRRPGLVPGRRRAHAGLDVARSGHAGDPDAALGPDAGRRRPARHHQRLPRPGRRGPARRPRQGLAPDLGLDLAGAAAAQLGLRPGAAGEAGPGGALAGDQPRGGAGRAHGRHRLPPGPPRGHHDPGVPDHAHLPVRRAPGARRRARPGPGPRPRAGPVPSPRPSPTGRGRAAGAVGPPLPAPGGTAPNGRRANASDPRNSLGA